MAKHKWLSKDGEPVRMGEAPGDPYCIYIECIYCRHWLCNNGCDDLDEECPEKFEALFEWEHLVEARDSYFE